MATSLHISKHRVVTFTASDSSSIPANTVTAVAGGPGVTVSAANNQVVVTGVSAGTTSVTYSAPGYLDASESFTVSPLPSLIPADGPEA